MSNFRLEYSWDNEPANTIDLTPFCSDNGIKVMAQRNTIGTLEISIKYRVILALLLQQSLSLTDFLVERFSAIGLYDGDDKIFGGYLANFPNLQSSSIDADIPLTFNSWQGLTSGGFVAPNQTFNAPLDSILSQQLRSNINASGSGRKPWPITIGHCDALPQVTWTVQSYMQLDEFLTQRVDNATGAGPFDIIFTVRGVFEIWQNYGVDLTRSINLRFGSQDTNVTEFDFPAFDDDWTDVTMSGAGNGYGDQGTTLVSRRSNPDSRARHYWGMLLAQDSSVSEQHTLDNNADKRLKYTASPISTPTVTIDATQLGLSLREHAEHGDLWLGDVIKVTPQGIYSAYPHADSYRVDKIEMDISKLNTVTAKLTMVDPTGSEIKDDDNGQ